MRLNSFQMTQPGRPTRNFSPVISYFSSVDTSLVPTANAPYTYCDRHKSTVVWRSRMRMSSRSLLPIHSSQASHRSGKSNQCANTPDQPGLPNECCGVCWLTIFAAGSKATPLVLLGCARSFSIFIRYIRGRTDSTFPSGRSSPPNLVHEQSSIQTQEDRDCQRKPMSPILSPLHHSLLASRLL
jgi:hypothetical protein